MVKLSIEPLAFFAMLVLLCTYSIHHSATSTVTVDPATAAGLFLKEFRAVSGNLDAITVTAPAVTATPSLLQAPENKTISANLSSPTTSSPPAPPPASPAPPPLAPPPSPAQNILALLPPLLFVVPTLCHFATRILWHPWPARTHPHRFSLGVWAGPCVAV